jgi:hypothetical protein
VNVPGAANVCDERPFWARLPESQAPLSDVHVWVVLSRLVAVTVVPAATLSTGGLKLKFWMVSALVPAGGGAAVVGGEVVVGAGPVAGAVVVEAVDAGAVVAGDADRRAEVVGAAAFVVGTPVVMVGAVESAGGAVVVVVVAAAETRAGDGLAPPEQAAEPATMARASKAEAVRMVSPQYDDVAAVVAVVAGEVIGRPSAPATNQTLPTPWPLVSPAFPSLA